MNTFYGKIDPPELQALEIELPICEACLEETDFVTELCIHRLNLKPTSKVCSSCLSELHEELLINTTE